MSVLAADPLLSGDIDLTVVLIVILKTVVVFAFLLVATMLMIWFERKIIGDMQNRIGPNRAGPFGILQSLADGVKAFFKEDLIPERSDRIVFKLAPYLSLLPALITFSVIPIGGSYSGDEPGVVSIFGRETYLQLADPPIGILLVLAMSSIAVYGIMLAGWSSGSKYPLLGSVRASAQMVSYEAALGLSVVAVVLVSGTLTTSGIVAAQSGWDWNLWATAGVPFIIFLIAGTAEVNRPPFDLVEAEQELVGGFNTEYSGIRFAIFYLAEFMNAITFAAVITTLFLGGPNGPELPGSEVLWGMVWFFGKVVVLLFCFVWVRATLPRLRYDQLMDLGWKLLIPLALGWLLLVAGLRVGDVEDWSPAIVVAVGFVVLAAGYGLLLLAFRAVVHPACARRKCAAVMGLLGGFAVTLRQIGRRNRLTRKYAKDEGGKRDKPERLHGRHVLNRYEDGMEKCIGCELCAGVCPARCIYVRGKDNPPDAPVSPGERYGFVYEINYLRCIHCDLCVEACPTEAITESKLFEFSFLNRADAIYTRDELLVDDEGLPRQLPWEDWTDADAVAPLTSAWVRATASSGDASYVGKVGWSGELGFGVKPPESGSESDPGAEPS